MSNEMREEFERVAALEGLNIAHHPQFHGDYLALDTQWRWLGFKHGQMVATAAAEAKSGWCICRCGANPISHSNINGVQTYSCPLCKAVCVTVKNKDTEAAAEAKYREGLEKLVEVGSKVLDFTGRKCWFDHNGNCQEHGVSNPCEVKLLVEALELAEPLVGGK